MVYILQESCYYTSRA